MKINFAKLGAWALGRLKERSTYAGLATIAAAAGAKALGVQLDTLGVVVPMILGGGLVGASTSQA